MKKYLLLIALIIMVASDRLISAQHERGKVQSDRVKVASVGERTIYLDEIQKDKHGIKMLRQLIKKEILKQELMVHKIKPSQETIEQEAAALAEREWKALGKTEEAREKALETVRYKMTKLHEALVIWKLDKRRADDFAKRELEPLGITEDYWKWLISEGEGSEAWKRLEKVHSARSLDNQAILQLDRDRLLTDAKRFLEILQLKHAVVPNVPVTGTEMKRLLDLTQNTEWIDVIIVTSREEDLNQLRDRLTKEGENVLSKAGVQYRRSRLSGVDLELRESNLLYRNYLFRLAIHGDSITPGESSAVFSGFSSEGKLAYWFIYIMDRKVKEGVMELQEQLKAKLNEALKDFKRDQEFESWLWTKLAEKTVIYLPEFQSALRRSD